MIHRLQALVCLATLCLSASTPFHAQQYGLEVEVVNDDIGVLVGALGATDLTGYTCYRAYITMENEDDFLSSISGGATNPTSILTTTSYYHSALGGPTPNGINALLFTVYPDLAYDSWVTIGLEGIPNTLVGERAVSTVQSNANPWTTNFDPGGGVDGGSIIIDDLIGGAWYLFNGDANGVAGTDLKVLAGQFTTDGTLSMQLYTQIFINGNGMNQVPGLAGANSPTFYWPPQAPGCTDSLACNFSPDAVSNDGSCTYPNSSYVNCDDNCLNDADGDGVCDELEDLGCVEAAACNYEANATEEDGSCITLASGESCCAAGIYFSEFTEGPASDTYFEIHNASGDSVLLDAFHVGRTANQLNPDGGFDFEDIQFPSGLRLGPDDVFVVAEAGANAAILAAADMTVPEISSGDDALGLIRSSNDLIVDQIGVPGTDEGLGWQIAGVPDATYNRTIRRKPAVADGNGGDWSSSAGTNADDSEWIVLSDVDLTGIGVHDQDGVCVGESPYLVRGCNNPLSCAYHPEAIAHVQAMCDFGSCYGCMEPLACNFHITATFQGDSVCLYPLDLYGVDYVDCDNVCLEDDDGDGVCNLNEPVGCMASDACNYDPVAEFDDGSCEYVTCAGCTDPIACNYLPSATFDDGTCDYACITGCTDSIACNYDAINVFEDGSCDYTCITGCTEVAACNYDAVNVFEDGSCEYTSCLGCTDPDACNFDPSAIYDDGTCSYLDTNNNGICDGFEVYGCTDETACNYDSSADINSGCLYPVDIWGIADVDCEGNCTCASGPDGTIDQGDFGLRVQTYAQNIGMVGTTDLTGYNTYRLYAKLSSPDDFLSTVYGDADFPTRIRGGNNFYHSVLGGMTNESYQSLLFPAFPDLEYDSFVTIGMTAPANVAAGEQPINSVGDPVNNWIPAFDPLTGASGQDIIIDTQTGGSWFPLYPDANAFAGEDSLVLIGQFTTDNPLTGVVSFNVFINGDQSNGSLVTIPIPGLASGCTDPTATNYCGCAAQDDGSCEFGLGCIDVVACNYNPAATEDDGSCLYLDAVGECGGSCAEDADADGVCDDVDDCIGTVDACGVCNGAGAVYACGCEDVPAGECDCDGNTLDAAGVCGGDCTTDADADGVCDDVDGCADLTACNYLDDEAEYCLFEDECGVCGGCGIPAGDCDCFGNELDAIGVCGGDCIADLDGDGICDDDPDCQGVLDDCGVCNGPGAIFECGCTQRPVGDCDCEGNQLDAVGECGGDCTSDLDGDGVCDDVEVPGCMNPYACNYLSSATDDDGSCAFDDALGVCGGACAQDLDADGVCDDEDDCIGTVDACGICNGPGAIYDCGCSSIPAGDCDCAGNALDALGVCGGACSADVDGDGICDEVDSCVGTVDACGVCNGPGEVWPCGCQGLPAGACDCAGNTLDATGVCGGGCVADLNANGICDDQEAAGCTQMGACNYSADAVFDDGTCDFDTCRGCTYSAAENYDPTASVDDGSCLGFDPPLVCPGDNNADGFVGIDDIIFILTIYGTNCALE